MNEHIAYIIIGIGFFFNFTGAFSLLRFKDLFSRLSASITCTTFGTCLVLFGAFLISPLGNEGLKALLCIVFLLLTTPAAAHSIARGSYLYGERPHDRTVVDRYSEALKGK